MIYHHATPRSHAFRSEKLRAWRELSEIVKCRKFKGTLGHYYKVLVSVIVDKEQENKSPGCNSSQSLVEEDSSCDISLAGVAGIALCYLLPPLPDPSTAAASP
jgi:hypothetical protein